MFPLSQENECWLDHETSMMVVISGFPVQSEAGGRTSRAGGGPVTTGSVALIVMNLIDHRLRQIFSQSNYVEYFRYLPNISIA